MTAKFPIGGFFELERPSGFRSDFPSNAVNSGRSGLELILRHYRPKKLWVPAYICNCVPEFLDDIGQNYTRYHVNATLELEYPIELKTGEMLLYVNYFGIKDSYCDALQKQYGQSLILDLTQAYFFQSNAKCPLFSSLRKFFGVPDGGLVTGVPQEEIDTLAEANGAEYASHLLYRADGQQEEAYRLFKANGEHFNNEHPLRMSRLSQYIMQNVDLDETAQTRHRNFSYLHQKLAEHNLLKIPPCVSPLSYPLLLKDGASVRTRLIARGVFVPLYWPDLQDLNAAEHNIMGNTIHLPIDQRYELNDMDGVIEVLANETGNAFI